MEKIHKEWRARFGAAMGEGIKLQISKLIKYSSDFLKFHRRKFINLMIPFYELLDQACQQ